MRLTQRDAIRCPRRRPSKEWVMRVRGYPDAGGCKAIGNGSPGAVCVLHGNDGRMGRSLSKIEDDSWIYQKDIYSKLIDIHYRLK